MKRFLPEIPEALLAVENASAVVIPVPYDGTSTWHKGADRGPGAILDASNAVEWYDIETASEPHTHGIATLAPIGHPDGPEGDPERLTPIVERAVGEQLDAGRLPIVLGGEHSVSIGAIYAAAARFEDLTVLQIDAHADTREAYEGSPHNHACVMARARERAKIVQVGIRSIDAAEAPGLDPDRVFWAHELRRQSAASWIERVVERLTDHVYITIDLDAFDPSLMPATGTPEPGGLLWHEVNDLVRAVCARSRVVGFDVVELCPQPGLFACEFLAVKLVLRCAAEVFASRS